MLIFETKIWADAQGLFEGVERVLLAVSGGGDSVAMAHVLAAIRKQGRFSCEFVIGHVNHCLRGNHSDADEAFVRTLADSLAIPVVTQAVDVKAYAKKHRLSIETAGRVLRLKTLAAMAAEHDCDCIATAHHKDDLAETMIHRLMRGTGFRGLCGILPDSKVYGFRFIRPMLNVRRSEVITYCQQNGLTWREDVSNKHIRFTRNRIRHCLLPMMQKECGDLIELLAELSLKSRRFLEGTEKHAQAVIDQGHFSKEECLFPKKALETCLPWVFYEVVRESLVRLRAGLRDYTHGHFKAIGKMLSEERGKMAFPGGIEVCVDNHTIYFRRHSKTTTVPQRPVTLEIGHTVRYDSFEVLSRLLSRGDVNMQQFLNRKDAFVEWFDADKVSGSLEIRARSDGSRFWPIGAAGQKKVGRFLIDGGLNSQTKKDAFIIADSEKILWLVPIRMSEQAKVTDKTTQILEIRISR